MKAKTPVQYLSAEKKRLMGPLTDAEHWARLLLRRIEARKEEIKAATIFDYLSPSRKASAVTRTSLDLSEALVTLRKGR